MIGPDHMLSVDDQYDPPLFEARIPAPGSCVMDFLNEQSLDVVGQGSNKNEACESLKVEARKRCGPVRKLLIGQVIDLLFSDSPVSRAS